MIFVDVNSSMYIDFNKKKNKECPKLGHHVKISKCKNFLPKAKFQIGTKKLLWLQINTVPWIFVIGILTMKKMFERFIKNNFKNKKEFVV